MLPSHGHTISAPNNRVADLDGIRAIAIWMVMLMHAYYAFPIIPGAFSSVPKP